jgi:hypothetical protein
MASKVYYMNIDDYDEKKTDSNKNIKDKLIGCFNNTITNIKFYIKNIDKEKSLTILNFSYFALFLYNFILFIQSKNMDFFYLFNIIISFIFLIVMNIITNTFDIFLDDFMLSELKKTMIFLVIILIIFSFIDIIIIYISKMKLNIPNSSIVKAGFSIIGQLIISLLYIYILFKKIISIKKKNVNIERKNNISDIEKGGI